jgi:predicted metalloprotease with PDZ domain
VQMSQMAPFTDAARAVDKTNFTTTFTSYYTYGAAVALALDLSLRDRSNGKLSLDDYMQAMWRVHGKPASQPGVVAKPYTLADARARLAEVSGDRAFADEFFDKYVEGRDAADYARLLLRAGYVLRKRSPGAAWLGSIADGNGTINNLTPWGSPAFEAGLDQGDVLIDVDGKPGDRLTVTYKRRGGATGRATIVLKEDPTLEAVTVESTGVALTADQKAFRDGWLGSKIKK